jgi:LysM repeat protein
MDWEITFTPVKDPFVKAQTKKTNESGAAVFTVTPGNWTISEKVKSGWKPITPSTVHLTLDQYAPPGAMDPVVFKNLQPPCKSSIVVEKTGLGRDANGGLVWLGPLAGWQVTVARADGGMTPVTKTTDASGKATFDGLLPGVYKVTEQMQIGWKAVSENPQTVVHMDCETTRVLFENEEIKGKLTIRGQKLFKAWEPPYKGTQVGLAGWVISATLTGTDAMTTTVTNALGEYQFSEEQLKAAGMGFPGATIQVCEEDRANWIHITPDCVNVTFPYPVPADYPGAVVNFTNIQDPPLPGTSGSAATTSCSAVHKVAAGQNLSSIAARYGTTVSAIANANGITNVNYVRAGQMLCIP